MSPGDGLGVTERAIFVLNVLPCVLAHYERALVSELREVGGCRVEVHHASIERQAVPSRVRRAVHLTKAYWGMRNAPGPLIIAWPALGIAEPTLWRWLRRRGTTIMIVHDPLSLRKGRHWPRSVHRAAARLGRSSRVRVVAHSEGARVDLERLGWRVADVIGLPILVADRPTPGRGNSVLVLGQFKAARDLETLAEIGGRIADLGYVPEIRGRGWPAIEGWKVDDRFVPEQEFSEALGGAMCLLIPYTRYYQSEVAVRAIELGVPVVGRATDFLVDLLGSTWPGLVHGPDPTDWLTAIAGVATAQVRGQLVDLARAAHERSLRSWAEMLHSC